MKIGINTLFLIPGEVGGSETYFVETMKAMLRLEPQHEIFLYTNVENEGVLREHFKDFGSTVHYRQTGIPATNRYSRIIREQTQLPRMANADGLDVLWSPGYTCPLRCRVPQVVSVLDMQYRSHPEDLSWLARLTTDILVRGAARAARRLIAISRFSSDEIVRYTSADADRITVTPLAASQAFSEEHDELPEGIETPFLLCVSNSYPHKNVPALIDAFSRLAPDYRHSLVLVGKARRGEQAVHEAIESSGFAPRIHRLSGVAYEELISLYRAADVFVFPSLYEGFGLPVLESMVAGTPVVTTASGSLSEVGGESVIYVDGEDRAQLVAGIRRVLDLTPGERADLVQRGREHAAGFTWERTAQKTLEAIRLAAV